MRLLDEDKPETEEFPEPLPEPFPELFDGPLLEVTSLAPPVIWGIITLLVTSFAALF